MTYLKNEKINIEKYKHTKKFFKFSFLDVIIATIIIFVFNSSVFAVADIRNINISPNCGPDGAQITVYFEVTDAAWTT
jgi:hypothetical protein